MISCSGGSDLSFLRKSPVGAFSFVPFCCSHPGLEMKRRGALLRAVGAIWDCVGEMVTCMLRASGAGCGECDVIPPRPLSGSDYWSVATLMLALPRPAGVGDAPGSDGHGRWYRWRGIYKTPKGKRGRASRNLGVHGRDLAPSKPGVVPQTEEKLRKGCEKIKIKIKKRILRSCFVFCSWLIDKKKDEESRSWLVRSIEGPLYSPTRICSRNPSTCQSGSGGLGSTRVTPDASLCHIQCGLAVSPPLDLRSGLSTPRAAR